MTSYSPAIDPVIERAKPLLGTIASMRVQGLDPVQAHAAIDAGFAAMGAVHAAMSFHEGDSDVSRLNRDAYKSPVNVSGATYAVIAHAQAISALTQGAFDITVAPQLVARGHLPCPAYAPDPDRGATWRDIALLPEKRIRFHRPLWIDLGGIAKGFAVDCAIETLQAFDPTQACVIAGGDLRIAGPEPERVRLAAEDCRDEDLPVFELKDGSLASSESREAGPHIDPVERKGAHRQFVSVAAPRCMDADALTKVVMARRACSATVLKAFGASAAIYDAEIGWRTLGGHA